MNARGIPTAAYEVLHLLSCTRWGTSPSGYPPPPARSDGGGYPRWCTPHLGTPWPGPMGWGTRGGVGMPLEVGTPIRVPPPRPGWLDLAGVPPAGVDWQTKWNYYLPSRTTYAVGNKTGRKLRYYFVWGGGVGIRESTSANVVSG